MKNPEGGKKQPIKTKHTHTQISPKPQQKNPNPIKIRRIMQKTTTG